VTSIVVHGQRFDVDTARIREISAKQSFDSRGPRLFGGTTASAEVYNKGRFVGSVADGGTCNVSVITIAPHLHGTHTECVGHLTSAPYHVVDALRQPILPATIVTVEPVSASSLRLEWVEATRAFDRLIGHELLAAVLTDPEEGFLEALIVRTRPNSPAKLTANYDATGAPYFTTAAMRFIRRLGVRHLVVDLPSVDRMDDGGKLAAHRIFFSLDAANVPANDRTITELAYVPDAVADGACVLNIQIPPFAADAAPSRLLVAPVTRSPGT